MEKKINIHAIRLKPGDDLRSELQDFVVFNAIQAGWVMSCAGSLSQFCIRFANQDKGVTEKGYYEVIGLSGTLSMYGSHLHIGISNDKGDMIGGHLLEGCTVYTTAEIIIGESLELSFVREKDSLTGWNELQILKQGVR
jgi:predicted DNA-binding protein with PD1-like motif